MGKRITPLLPRIYHNGDGLVPFVELLEPEVGKIEDLTAELTNLIDIDKIPDKYLPYLASKTNTPLMGDDPALWRGQIRNWPEILKIKGTERSLKMFFRSLGFTRYDIKTFWRDANGNYVTEKPDGEPFKGPDGVWYNSRTHYFSVRLWWSVNSRVGSEADGSILNFIRRWLPRVKPAYAELLEYESAIMLDDSMTDELLEYLSVGQGLALAERDDVSEYVFSAYSPALDESLWPRFRYSDPDLYYDGVAKYDAQAEGIELTSIRPYILAFDTGTPTELSSPGIWNRMAERETALDKTRSVIGAVIGDSETVREKTAILLATPFAERETADESVISTLKIIV